MLVNFQSSYNTAFNLKVEKYILESLLNKAYWQRIKNIISIAENLGLYMGILPLWGNVVINKNLRLDNMEVYLNFITEKFGRF